MDVLPLEVRAGLQGAEYSAKSVGILGTLHNDAFIGITVSLLH